MERSRSGVGGEDFGQQLRKYRQRSRLTQTALSNLSAVSVRALRNLEQSQVALPRPDTVRLLADALRLTAQERVSFELAAGCEAGEALFEALVMPAIANARPLHGREWEVNTIVRRVLSEHERITAVTGFGGVGKTHLAVAAAQALHAQAAMPTVWVPLRQTPGGLSAGAATHRRAGSPHRARSLRVEGMLTRDGENLDQLVRLVEDRSVLLVLDGNDVGQVPRDTLRTLMCECPRLQILETARTPQGSPEEYQLALRPLTLAAATARPEEITTAPAMALLLELITDLQPGFDPDTTTLRMLTEICHRLDGLPRALEAAASWFTIVSADELLGMARNEPLLLATHPGDRADAVAMVRDAVLAQPLPYRNLLTRLSNRPCPWTVETVVAYLGMPRAQAARAVYALLQCGLITRVTSPVEQRVGFTVLNAVRAYLRSMHETAGQATAGQRRWPRSKDCSTAKALPRLPDRQLSGSSPAPVEDRPRQLAL
ncbi:helix-turn-helix domain-containing protein [Kitasatospora sp. NPDC088351]|uniref:helix-turn-helix domain-containing protein n=1 Tax=Kitasatospora sp. NPDC088351 TaxID=3155180 RepID=UPI0034288A00